MSDRVLDFDAVASGSGDDLYLDEAECVAAGYTDCLGEVVDTSSSAVIASKQYTSRDNAMVRQRG